MKNRTVINQYDRLSHTKSPPTNSKKKNIKKEKKCSECFKKLKDSYFVDSYTFYWCHDCRDRLENSCDYNKMSSRFTFYLYKYRGNINKNDNTE